MTTLTKTQKIAILLHSLGNEQAADILDQLDAGHAERITQEIAGISRMPHQVQRAVLREFRMLVSAASAPTDASAPYLAGLSPVRAAELLAEEPPHIIARLLVGLPTEHAGAVLEHLPAAVRPLVAARIAHTPPPSTELYARLETALRAKAARLSREESAHGQATLTAMMGDTPTVDTHSPSLYDAIDAEIQTFHALSTLPDDALTAIAGAATDGDLLIALRGADPLLTERVLAALPFTRRAALRNRLHRPDPVTLRAITEAQARIARLVEPSVEYQREREPVHA